MNHDEWGYVAGVVVVCIRPDCGTVLCIFKFFGFMYFVSICLCYINENVFIVSFVCHLGENLHCLGK